MTIQVSTGLRDALLITGSLKAQLDLGFIKIYASGSPPATANDAITGTLLCTISVDGGGTGLTFENAANSGVIAKEPTETWKGTNAATGDAAYYRFVEAGDTGVLSTTEKRVQGTVGVAGADLNLSSIGLTSGAEQAIDYYTLSVPSTA